MTVALDILLPGPPVRVGRIGPTAVAVYQGDITEQSVDDMWQAYRVALERIDGPMSSISVIHPGTTRFLGKARERSLAMARELQHQTVASAIVIKATGLVGSVARTVAATFNMMNKPPHPQRIFAGDAEAAAWIMGLHPSAAGAEAIEAAIAALEAPASG